VDSGAAELLRLRRIVEERLGLVFEEHRLDILDVALRARERATGAGSASAYVELLSHSRAEQAALADLVTIPETHFFRNRDQFAALESHVLPHLERAHPARLRILSAGCASGEEPYTVAMILDRKLPALAARADILGVDLSEAQLALARAGRYAGWSLRETPPEYRQAYFTAKRDRLELSGKIRARASFERRNLAEANEDLLAAESWDVVFCRNVTIYFSAEQTRALIARLARALSPGGFLFLGHTETLRGVSSAFHLQHRSGAFYYQRRDGAAAAPQSERERRAPREPPRAQPMDTRWFQAIGESSSRVERLGERGKADAETAGASTGSARTEAAPGTPFPAVHPERSEAESKGQSAKPMDAAEALELFRQERFEAAADAMEGIPRAVRERPEIALLEAIIRLNRGDVPGALERCERALERDELDAGAHFALGLCRESQGRLEDARGEYETAAYLEPAFGIALLRLGIVARRLGDRDGARRAVEHARALLPREAASRLLLFGGNFGREALMGVCAAELAALGGGGR